MTWAVAASLLSPTAILASDYEDAVTELNTCTLNTGVYSLESTYVKDNGVLALEIRDTYVERVFVKMDDAEVKFDGSNVKFECSKPGCLIKQLYTAWPHKLTWQKKLNDYTLYYCDAASQQHIYDALISGD